MPDATTSEGVVLESTIVAVGASCTKLVPNALKLLGLGRRLFCVVVVDNEAVICRQMWDGCGETSHTLRCVGGHD